MKKFAKYFSLASLAMTGALFMTSCDDTKDNSDFTISTGPSASVYFTIQADQDVALGEGDTSFGFYIYRVSKTGSESAQLSWSGEYEGFNVPTSVNFADGENSVYLTVGVDLDAIKANYEYSMTVTVSGTESTAFTQNYITFNVIYTAWQYLGEAVYTDYFVGTFFGVENVSYYVDILEHPEIKGLYRLVNPYGEAYPYNEPGDWDASTDSFMYINASNPELVYMADQNGNPANYISNMDWGYGNFIMTTFCTYYLRQGDSATAAEYAGTMEDGVIYLAAASTLCAMADYNDGGLYSNNFSGPASWVELP